jgi:hypothetical protein
MVALPVVNQLSYIASKSKYLVTLLVNRRMLSRRAAVSEVSGWISVGQGQFVHGF